MEHHTEIMLTASLRIIQTKTALLIFKYMLYIVVSTMSKALLNVHFLEI